MYGDLANVLVAALQLSFQDTRLWGLELRGWTHA